MDVMIIATKDCTHRKNLEKELESFNSIVCGALLIALAIPRGTIKDSYASWDRYIV